MKRLIFSSALVSIAALTLTACGAAESGPPKATGESPSIIAQVECDDDGVANVHVTYGSGVDETFLIGNTPHGDMDKFDRDYGMAPGYPEATLTVETSPTRGTCLTRFTDDDSGDVLAEKETAGTARLEAVVPAMD